MNNFCTRKGRLKPELPPFSIGKSAAKVCSSTFRWLRPQSLVHSVLLVFLCCQSGVAQETNRIENGQSRADVVARLGEPEGNITSGNSTYLTYAGMRVKLTDGIVADLDPQFNEKLAEARQTQEEKDAFAAEQTAKGLVNYQGRWLMPEEYAAIKMTEINLQIKTAAKNRDAKIYTVKRNDGTIVDHKPLVVDGKVTVVGFLANGHAVSAKLSDELDELAAADHEIRLCKLGIKNAESKLISLFGLQTLPHVRVLDAFGNLVAMPSTDPEKIADAIKQAKRQSRITKIYVN